MPSLGRAFLKRCLTDGLRRNRPSSVGPDPMLQNPPALGHERVIDAPSIVWRRMGFGIAMRSTLDGAVLLAVQVQPGASSVGLGEVDAWRERLHVRLPAQAREGRANHALCVQMASWLRCAPSQITIAEGPTSRNKRLRIEGLTVAQIVHRLEQVHQAKTRQPKGG